MYCEYSTGVEDAPLLLSQFSSGVLHPTFSKILD